MATKVFLDANILLDAYQQRDASGNSAQIIRLAHMGVIRAFVTPAVLHICSYYLGQTQPKSQVRQLFIDLLQDVTVIELDHRNAVAAVNSPMTDMEDALQYYAALQHGIQVFLSNDKKLAKAALPQLPVVTPHNFLK